MLQNTIDRHQPLECYRVAIANRCISQVICLVTILANSPDAGELLNGEILVIRPKFMAFGIGARTAIFAAPYARDHNLAQKLPRPCRKHVGEARPPRRHRDTSPALSSEESRDGKKRVS